MDETQLALLEETYSSDSWCKDDWETPDGVARYMASLVLPTDKRILEPAAGTGQIAKAIEKVVDHSSVALVATELNPVRRDLLQVNCPMFQCWQFNFISPNINQYFDWQFDAIATNPPFSLAIEFLAQSLRLLDKANPDARLIYLLPGDFFQSQEIAKQFAQLDCRIYQRHSIVGRVGYLQNGVPYNNRQIHDAVFIIKPGRNGDALPEKFVRLW